MITITVHKANPISTSKPRGDGIIRITEDLLQDLLQEELRRTFEKDAKGIMYVLKKHLPQGTLHQLLILMLQNEEHLIRGATNHV